ncbi:exosortase B [Aquabacterium sp.]|jgi:exosortase B|uniref:exosortase B n=1 Tax=Aquabacterium sp. TaxID=1872578 RepID=UPI00248815F3|nr:exosortase B [Aquabacterium sp.]MDI1351036.1 exosortase B [Aquabacterium sp.]
MTVPAHPPDSGRDRINRAAGMLQALPAIVVFMLAFAVLYAGTYIQLAHTVWSTDEQGHGPLILAASAWLLWTKRDEIFDGHPQPAPWLGFSLIGSALAMFVVGRSQSVIEIEAFSQILVLAGGLVLLQGKRGLKLAWFPLAFLLFVVPLPGSLVQAITMPLKSAVSVVAEEILHQFGYPIARTGVTLVIGQYQLLVADACSGLNSLFTLEALGLLYMNLMAYKSRARNIALAIMIVPISFISNITRVIVLVLITYYYGDEAGQGFAHDFAGMVLFMVALVLTYGFDRLLARFVDDEGGARGRR